MLGARRAALASLVRLARQARTFSAMSRAVSLQQETPAVCAAKQADWLFCRGFAAAAEPAPAPAAASNGYVKTVRAWERAAPREWGVAAVMWDLAPCWACKGSGGSYPMPTSYRCVLFWRGPMHAGRMVAVPGGCIQP